MRDFKKLEVWRRGHRLTLDVYGVTRAFPREELYGITSQMRRASAAISANVAEGCGRGSNADLLFLQPADHKRLNEEVIEIQHMLASFIRSLKAFGNKARKPDLND
jgi:hypothetical protein